MIVLVLNCGSSSLKYQLLDMDTETVLARGLVERIGLEGTRIKYARETDGSNYESEIPAKSHREAIETVLEILTREDIGVLYDLTEIDAIGHRIVNAGEHYSDSVIIDDEVLHTLEGLTDLAPLHNPAAVSGIKACRELMPEKPMTAVFDTAFHQTMPAESYIYSIPYEYYEKYGIRKYGFHGTSHKYVAQRAATILGRPLDDLKLITCHLGNGASITAIRNGRVFETTMGFTPLAGLAMGTRCGNIDPSIIFYIAEKEGRSLSEIEEILNTKSGILGISGISSDFRDVEKAAEEGNERAGLAIKVYSHRVRAYIGSFIALMNGVDAIVFTAGVGENDAKMRSIICRNLDNLGVNLDEVKNLIHTKAAIISEDYSRVKVLYVPTNEELMIARDTVELLHGDDGLPLEWKPV
ncbi:MAG: acetate kinase [Mogibacterium sp.]|nr:acetate kinase [Mogibacterium sp.]